MRQSLVFEPLVLVGRRVPPEALVGAGAPVLVLLPSLGGHQDGLLPREGRDRVQLRVAVAETVGVELHDQIFREIALVHLVVKLIVWRPNVNRRTKMKKKQEKNIRENRISQICKYTKP